jgi:hypothetical protein
MLLSTSFSSVGFPDHPAQNRKCRNSVRVIAHLVSSIDKEFGRPARDFQDSSGQVLTTYTLGEGCATQGPLMVNVFRRASSFKALGLYL